MKDAHILVVDDDDRIRDLLKRFLIRAGYRVTAVPQAGAARKMLQTMACLLYTSPSPRDLSTSRMPSSA